MTLTLTSCGNDKAVREAATKIGIASAKVNLSPLPDECGRDIPHAPLVKGTEVLSVLKLERRQLDRANASKQRCNNFHNAQAEKLRN